jgi:hypothetical protein
MKKFFVVLIVIMCLVPLPNYIYSIAKSVQFGANCKDYLKLSADANSVVLAEKHLTTAINYLEENNITSGQAKFFVAYPKNDISLWYENLKAAQSQLQEMIEIGEYTELEQSNMLMKLRETLLNENGSVTVPMAVAFCPNGTLLLWINSTIWIFWLVCVFFAIYKWLAW